MQLRDDLISRVDTSNVLRLPLNTRKSINDFNDLVDPRTLALYCLGPKPSAYVLCTIEREEKKSKYLVRCCHPLLLFFFFFFKFYFGMMMKFN